MSGFKKSIKLDNDILLEYHYMNKELINFNNYYILRNVINGENINNSFFYESELNANELTDKTYNTYDSNLRLINSNLKKWSPVDINDTNLNIDFYNFSEGHYNDVIKLWISKGGLLTPDNENKGLFINTYIFDYSNKNIIYLSNFYYEWGSYLHKKLNPIQIADKPFILDEMIWDKFIEIKIPSVFETSNLRIVDSTKNIPTPATLNFHLTGDWNTGLSIISPIFIDVGYITDIKEDRGKNYYYLTNPYQITINQREEDKKLGLTIKNSTDGDWIEISGSYGNSFEEWSSYLNNLIMNGQNLIIIYTIRLYEQGIKTDEIIIPKFNNIEESIKWRPIIIYTSSLINIEVNMKIKNSANNSYIEKEGSLILNLKEFAKYGKKLDKLNVNNAVKPIIYNSEKINPSNKNQYTINNSINNNSQKLIPVYYDLNTIIIKDQSATANNREFLGQYALNLLVHPTDNFFKFTIAEKISNNQIEYLNLSQSEQILLQFRNESDKLECTLYWDGGETRPDKGNLVFKLEKEKYDIIKKMSKGSAYFYIIQRNINGIETLIYRGNFKI